MKRYKPLFEEKKVDVAIIEWNDKLSKQGKLVKIISVNRKEMDNLKNIYKNHAVKTVKQIIPIDELNSKRDFNKIFVDLDFKPV